MSANSLIEESEVLTWEQFPINEVFVHDDVFWMKMSDEDILRVRPTSSGGWMGYGTTFKYDPSWNISFDKIGTEKSAEVLQKDLYHERKSLTLVFLVSVTLIGLVGFITWWLSR